MRTYSRWQLFLATLALVIVGGVLGSIFEIYTVSAKSDKDKTPPVISELRTESITPTSATVLWVTDEPADSDISYGIDPKTNIKGPSDTTLTLSHAIVLSNLVAQTTYAFCVQSQDESNNKSEGCGTFITTKAGGGGGRGPVFTRAFMSGFAYPNALMYVTLRALPFGTLLEYTTQANADGSFIVAFDRFPQGFYAFTVSASNKGDTSSTRKGILFEFSGKDLHLFKEGVLLPPTLTLARAVVAQGDDIVVTGLTTPYTGVLLEVEGVSYETKSTNTGEYRISVNSARFPPGKVSLRVRSSVISEFGFDYSPSKTVTVTASSVPEADLNADGAITITDLSIFLATPTDLNNDGKINSADFSIFLRAFIFK